MNDEAIVIQLLLQNSPIWVAFMLRFVPALVAGVSNALRRAGISMARCAPRRPGDPGTLVVARSRRQARACGAPLRGFGA